MAQRKCIFCGGFELTKEHAIPRWVMKTLKGSGPGRNWRQYPRREGGYDEKTWLADDFLAVKVVCRTCNSGWLNDLETQARPLLTPMIRGKGKLLSPEDQRVIATWAAKTDLLLQYARDKKVPIGRRRALFRGDVPPGTVVWLACFQGDARYRLGYQFHPLEIGRKAQAAGRGNTYAGTFFIEHLVIQVLVPGGLGVAVARLGNWAKYLIQVWPSSPSLLTWPPQKLLGPRGIALIPNAFQLADRKTLERLKKERGYIDEPRDMEIWGVEMVQSPGRP